MKKGVLPSVLLVGSFALAGCATTVDNVKSDDPREKKDEAYATYLEDTYGEELPNLDKSVAIDYSLRLCSVLDGQQVAPAELDDWLDSEGLEGRDRVVFADMMYWGVYVYCSDNLIEVQHLRSITV